jgi:hypothetical protein
MRQHIEERLAWLKRRSKTLDLLPQYNGAVYSSWHDYLWGATPVAPIIVWWMLGSPPMWIVALAFAWAFLIAGYYTWRKEVGPRCKTWISGCHG